MRLRMRNLVSLAVAVAPLLTSVSCCWLCKPLVHGDVVPGASKGSALVKVLVTLNDEAGKCVINPKEDIGVNPKRVRVFRGSVIRWRVSFGLTWSAARLRAIAAVQSARAPDRSPAFARTSPRLRRMVPDAGSRRAAST